MIGYGYAPPVIENLIVYKHNQKGYLMEQSVAIHKCGQCNDEWLTEAEYLAHICPKSGAAPTSADNLGPEFVEIQRSALERGLDGLKEENAPAEQIAAQEQAIGQLTVVSEPAPEVTPVPPVQEPAPLVLQ